MTTIMMDGNNSSNNNNDSCGIVAVGNDGGGVVALTSTTSGWSNVEVNSGYGNFVLPIQRMITPIQRMDDEGNKCEDGLWYLMVGDGGKRGVWERFPPKNNDPAIKLKKKSARGRTTTIRQTRRSGNQVENKRAQEEV